MNTTDETIPTTPETPTEARARTARLNGAKCRGPISAEGKRRSSINALRHGLLARTILLPNENAGRFKTLIVSLEDEFQPVTPNEHHLIDVMAAARWRHSRAWSLEKSLITQQIQERFNALDPEPEDEPTQASAAIRHLADKSHSLELISRCEMRLDRQFNRARAALISSREARMRLAMAAANQDKAAA